jgi:spoIIIJ-associated protein
VALPISPVKRAETMLRAEGAQADSARRAIALLLGFVGIEAEADLYQASDRFEVELWGPDDRVLLEEEGRVLLAIEHLVPRMMRGLDAEPIPVRVDCDNFHMIREERLRDLAQRVAAEVRRTGRYQILDELDPSERRIIHVTLKDDPGVATESLGDGYFKRLKVMLSDAPEDLGAEEGEG